MSPRRVNPRHVTDSVSVSPATTSRDGVTVTTGAPRTVKCQVEHTIQLVATEAGPLVATVLTLRVPPRAAQDELDLFTPDSPVEHHGATSWVLSAAPVVRSGVLAYTRVVTGEQAARFGGAWPVTVTITPRAGLDAWGRPQPKGAPRTVTGWLKPGKTGEPVDWADTTVTEATLYLAGGDPITARDTVTVHDGAPLAGTWSVDGDPTPDDRALAVPLRRS